MDCPAPRSLARPVVSSGMHGGFNLSVLLLLGAAAVVLALGLVIVLAVSGKDRDSSGKE